MKYLFILFVLFFIQCSTTLSTKQDYTNSRLSLETGKKSNALENLPKEEGNSFIYDMEKAYLNLIQGKPEIDELIDYARKIEQRIRFSASRELKTFFYLETPEGYYASEHEVIWLHILLSWGYSLRGEFEKAYTEAKISANLLNNNWSDEGRFDDPMLRIILSALWTMCGHWEEAQVDLRIASQLDPTLKWATKLASQSQAPKDFVLILGGSGPEPEWDPKLEYNPIRGFRALNFKSKGKKSKLSGLDDLGQNIQLNLSPDSTNWYKRHFIRDNEIQDLIKDSKYSEKIAITLAKEGGRSVLGVVGGVLVGLGGIALGAGIIYISVEAQISEGVVAGASIMIAGIAKGYEIAADTIEESIETAKKDLDISNDYRFVRFLPDYAWIGYSNQGIQYPLTIQSQNKNIMTIQSPIKNSIVSVEHFLDTN